MADNAIEIYKGDTKDFYISATQGARPFDLTGFSVYFIVPNEIKTQGKIIDAENGEAEITLDSDDTDIKTGEYTYIIRILSDNEQRTLVEDKMTIRGV